MFILPTKRINTFEGMIEFFEQHNVNFKKRINDLYVIDLKSYRHLQGILNINNRTVKKLLEYYNIPIRRGSDAVKTQWVNNDIRRKDIGKTFAKSSKGNTRCRIKKDDINIRLKKSNYNFIEVKVKEGKQIFKVECKYCKSILIKDSYSINKTHCDNYDDMSIKSNGEKLIKKYLKKNNIDFKKEYTFDDLKIIRNLRFDFAIFYNDELEYLIEFNGRQHYGINSKYTSDNIYKSDKMKINYCKINNIKLIVIPFWCIDRIKDVLDYHIILR